MKLHNHHFDEHEVLHELKHYLPSQAPLKDFIHHNTLHAFQYLPFFEGLLEASERLGYKVLLTLDEYRALYRSGRINEDMLDRILTQRHGAAQVTEWKRRMIHAEYPSTNGARIGSLRSNWKRHFHIDLDSLVHPILFRILCSYLDQGIAMWNFPVWHQGFLASMREMERTSFTSFFKTKRVRQLFLTDACEIKDLLKILVGDETLYAQYLFDQQFAHQGWSGMVSTIEDQPGTLLDTRKINLRELIVLELLLEIDALDFAFGDVWAPLALRMDEKPRDLFGPVTEPDRFHVLTLWQEAFEWSYYDEVLAGIAAPKPASSNHKQKTFQAMFCIDDRECSIRRHVEKQDTSCETFGTPGFFSVEFFFKPIDGKFVTKLCPAPVTPQYLIKEVGVKGKLESDAHFTKHTHSLFRGWLVTQTLGFWSAVKLFINIFRPSMGPATASSFKHMDRYAQLTIENQSPNDIEDGLKVGFTVPEMTQRVESLLKSIGLVKDFAPLVYIIGHGSSSVNNPHYAAYDCGACSGRAGSVNARVVSYMANHPQVREALKTRGIDIPVSTQFVGGLHDTTRDEIMFFDEDSLSEENKAQHAKHETVFAQALDNNAKERSRRFVSVNTKAAPGKVHDRVRLRSVSLFEPRPELNHATNALCIVGRRNLTRDLFLDRRSFLNSFDYQVDPEGNYLFSILKAAAPVCGGINLEYYFSRVDNQKLGAGTKLPHNVMGLFGVANGIDGDLRPGLPSQMIEVHDPVRLLLIVEHFPDVVLKTIQRTSETYEWFIQEWIHLVAVHPESHQLYYFSKGRFEPYTPLKNSVDVVPDITPILETHEDNIHVYQIA
jgi:uncharacterized protein YbcC (UPF0753/DUF2309 family)